MNKQICIYTCLTINQTQILMTYLSFNKIKHIFVEYLSCNNIILRLSVLQQNQTYTFCNKFLQQNRLQNMSHNKIKHTRFRILIVQQNYLEST
jgi:hypothetical protein